MNRIVPVENLSVLKAEPQPVVINASEASEFDYANALADTLPKIKTCGQRWFSFQGGSWQEVKRDTFRPQAQAILPPFYRTARREKTLLDHLEGRCQVDETTLRGAIAFDESGAVLINVKNGAVRVSIDSIALVPHDETLNFTRSLDVSFNPQAACPLFESTLVQCLPDRDDQNLFRLCCGNFFFPDCRFEVALVCYGEGGRGKSTIADPVASIFGAGLLTRLSMSQICDPGSYSLATLQFAAVNLGTELDSLAVDESGNFKTLVSGEPIEVRPIYCAPFTMQTACKLWFLANGLPRFKNGTEAELRRTRFLRFDYKPDKPDVTLKARLASERQGVFNFILAGLQRLLGASEIPLGGKQSREVHERFRISNDPLGAFVSEHCDFTPDGRVRKESICEAFEEFCERQNLTTAFRDTFLKRLYERFPQLNESRPRENGERIRVIEGIQLKSGSLD